MKAFPYLIESGKKKVGTRLERIDPREKMFDEKWLQDILVDHPDILPTGQIEPVFYPLMTVGKEVSVSTGRIDVLYLSGKGYPVIVETKLWRNPEARRQVIAQALDFAVAFTKWDIHQLEEYIKQSTRQLFGKSFGLKGLLNQNRLADEIEYEEFLDNVEKNLELGRFLVAIVSDRIRSSSLDIANELNAYPGLGIQLAMIELECFSLQDKGKASLLLVPRIAKRTEIIERSVVEVKIHQQGPPTFEIHQEKASKDKKKKITLTETEFWERLQRDASKDYNKVQELYKLFQEEPLVGITPGRNGLVFRRVSPEIDRDISLFYITTDGRINFKIQSARLQFKSLNYSTKIVEQYGNKIKNIIGGYRIPMQKVNIKVLHRVILEFLDEIDAMQSSAVRI